MSGPISAGATLGPSLTMGGTVRYGTGDLGYVVQIEHHEGTLVAREEPGVVELRVTMIFRREGNGWRVVHRHADSIAAQRAPQE